MNIRSSLAWLSSLFGLGSGYASTDPKNNEFRDGWYPTPSPGDDALAPVVQFLTADCRDLDRQCAKARAIVDGLRADWIGSGIGIEPTLVPSLAKLVPILRDGFNAWAEHAGVNDESLWTMQWTAAGDVATSGAFLWRWVQVEDAVGIPLRLLPLEVEWLAPEPLREVPAGRFSAGCETDELGRVVAWHLVDPINGSTAIVPAADIIHGSIQRRARQRVGEPSLAPLVLRLWQDDKLVVTELRASINTSNVAGVLETEDVDLALGGPAGAVSPAANPGAPPSAAMRQSRKLSPGSVLPLRPGEKWTTVENKRPAQGLAPFRQSLDGDLAGAAGVSRQWIDRDSSRANYSSMREDNLRTARAVGPIQAMLGRAMASRVYERLVPYLLINASVRWPATARERAALLRHEIRPDRIAYVDPQKDAAATVYQVEHNLKTLEEALAEQGRDLTTVLAKRASEQEAIDAAAVARVKRLSELAASSGVDGLTWAHLVTLAGASSAPGAYLGAAAPTDAAPPADAPARGFDGLRLTRDEHGEVVGIEPAVAP
jgi:lambda family phage portal protein